MAKANGYLLNVSIYLILLDLFSALEAGRSWSSWIAEIL